MDNKNLTRAQLLKIADMLAEEQLDKLNNRLVKVEYKESIYSKYIKRLLDIFLASILIVATIPINIIIMIITFFDVGLPIFFTQERIGKDGKLFSLIKFRNMKEIYDSNGDLLPPDSRVTKWGYFVRKTSLDELLNFYSILKGDMSIIGPRPLVPQYYHRFNNRHLARFYVKPGLELPPNSTKKIRGWNEQFENDIWYVQNISLKTDVKMFLLLFKFTFNKKNSNERGSAKRASFMGYDEEGNVIDQNNIPSKYITQVIRGDVKEE